MKQHDYQPVATFALTMLLCILLVSCLTGCATSVPVIARFPDVPTQLLEKCPQLQKINKEQVSIVDLTGTVVGNYTTYYECAVKSDSWIEWYNTQKKIYESVK